MYTFIAQAQAPLSRIHQPTISANKREDIVPLFKQHHIVIVFIYIPRASLARTIGRNYNTIRITNNIILNTLSIYWRNIRIDFKFNRLELRHIDGT